MAHRQGEYVQAVMLHEEALALLRALGDQSGIAKTLANVGWVTYLQGEHARAVILLEESLALMRTLEDAAILPRIMANLGLVMTEQGDYARATALYEECLRCSRSLGARHELALGLEGLAWVLSARGQAQRAAWLGGAAAALRAALGVPLVLERQAPHERGVQDLRAVMGEVEFAAAWTQGAAMTDEEVVTVALASVDVTP